MSVASHLATLQGHDQLWWLSPASLRASRCAAGDRRRVRTESASKRRCDARDCRRRVFTATSTTRRSTGSTACTFSPCPALRGFGLSTGAMRARIRVSRWQDRRCGDRGDGERRLVAPTSWAHRALADLPTQRRPWPLALRGASLGAPLRPRPSPQRLASLDTLLAVTPRRATLPRRAGWRGDRTGGVQPGLARPRSGERQLTMCGINGALRLSPRPTARPRRDPRQREHRRSAARRRRFWQSDDGRHCTGAQPSRHPDLSLRERSR